MFGGDDRINLVAAKGKQSGVLERIWLVDDLAAWLFWQQNVCLRKTDLVMN